MRGPGGAAAVGPHGGVAYSNRSYNYGGRHYARPAWGASQINVYQRGFVGYPGWRPYSSYYGLAPGLAAFTGLAFLSTGLLLGTYTRPAAVVSAPPETVYVYVVEEDGVKKQYEVDSDGKVLSTKIVS